MAGREEMSTSFGAAASRYEAGRPEYPAEAVSWLLAPVMTASGARVADVGAGTGKLTRAIVGTGAEVIAIDPDEAMLSRLHDAVPGVPTFLGRAEQLPLPDAAFDAVLLGQAWHWAVPEAASRECARILRSGGVLGLIWNIRDQEVPWVRRLTEIMRGSRAEEMLAAGGPTVAEPFAADERGEWRWTCSMTRQALLDMARSRSYIITAGDERRAEIESGMAALFDELGLTGDRTIELPYVTYGFRAVRP